MEKTRLDLLLLGRKLASTRSKAQELIRQGMVRVEGEICTKAGELVSPEAAVELLSKEHPYVSRGGVKLEAALKAFSVDPRNKKALDVGQSTGGFTHCLLLHGAAEVTGVEVGRGQLSPALLGDHRVRLLEQTDIRDLDPQEAGAPFQVCVADLSFISLELVLPHLPPFLAPGAEVIVLVKPQFEVGPEHIGSGGIVRDSGQRQRALEKVEKVCTQLGFTVAGAIPSPVAGGGGNQEFLLHLCWPSS